FGPFRQGVDPAPAGSTTHVRGLALTNAQVARRTAERALTAVVQEAHVQGVSTRRLGVSVVRRDRLQGENFPSATARKRASTSRVCSSVICLTFRLFNVWQY